MSFLRHTSELENYLITKTLFFKKISVAFLRLMKVIFLVSHLVYIFWYQIKMNKNETRQPFHHSFLDSHKVFEFEGRLSTAISPPLQCLKKHNQDLPQEIFVTIFKALPSGHRTKIERLMCIQFSSCVHEVHSSSKWRLIRSPVKDI